ncbi:class I SAM-dependent methyltransferase [Candidatus Binatus sp.]|uniref:class I SAM-dependent methyltransferase n=1 Tax=Candidatus Binatus sp. TaxID=2811406 RepID=UPI003C589355
MTDQNPEDLKIKGQQKAAWNDSAEGWKRWWPTFERAAQTVNDRLVELANVHPGNRVLDIATGSGEPALTAARAVGQAGRVVAVDMSPGMLAIARERVDAAGLKNVELVESDAEALKLDPHSFDAVLCRWGLMFMPDLDGVVRAMHRALKPGGRIATAVWSAADKVPMCGLARDAIQRITGITPPPGAPNPTKLADTSILERALSAANFRDVTIERLIVTFDFPSPDAFADFRGQIGGTRAMLSKMPADVARQVRDAVVASAREYATAAGVVRLSNETICFSARA